MTREEYLLNHDAHEGAEEETIVENLDELSEELKPCPFCGYAALLARCVTRYEVRCLNCDAVFYLDGYDVGADETVAAWNERAEITETPLCPQCGKSANTFAVDGRTVIGCENCLIRVRSVDLWKGGAGLEIGCPKCGRLNPVELFFHRVGGKITEAVGCSECISAVDAREWREKQ